MTALFVAVAPGLGPVTRDRVVRANEVYELGLREASAADANRDGVVESAEADKNRDGVVDEREAAEARGAFALVLQRKRGVSADPSVAPDTARLLQGRRERAQLSVAQDVSLTAEDRGHWYQAQARLEGGALAVSNLVWVPKGATSGLLRVLVVDQQSNTNLGSVPVQLSSGGNALRVLARDTTVVPAGEWTIRATVQGWVPAERTVSVAAGETQKPTTATIALTRSGPVQPVPTPTTLAVERRPQITSVTPSEIPTGVSSVTIRGRDLAERARLMFGGPEIVVLDRKFVSKEELWLRIRVPESAAGSRLSVTVRNPDGNSATGELRILDVAPNAQQGPPIETREAERAYGEVGCEEDRVVQAVYPLRPNEQYVEASVEVVSGSNLKEQEKLAPEYEPKSRAVIGRVRIRGLDRVLMNCPGGGNVTIGMRVRVRVRAEAQEY